MSKIAEKMVGDVWLVCCDVFKGILVSKIVDLHPLVVVASVILGSQYLGIVGMVISIPLAASMKLVLLEIYFELYSFSRK